MLKVIFDKLDSQKIGVIGAKNIDFKSLETSLLKEWNFLIIEIFKNPKILYDFDDFKKLAKISQKEKKGIVFIN